MGSSEPAAAAEPSIDRESVIRLSAIEKEINGFKGKMSEAKGDKVKLEKIRVEMGEYLSGIQKTDPENYERIRFLIKGLQERMVLELTGQNVIID